MTICCCIAGGTKCRIIISGGGAGNSPGDGGSGTLPAAKAASWGLATDVVPTAGVLPKAQALARRLAEGPIGALRMTKKMLEAEWTMELGTAMEAEAQAQALMMLGADHAEFHRSFVEKRPARFTGG